MKDKNHNPAADDCEAWFLLGRVRQELAVYLFWLFLPGQRLPDEWTGQWHHVHSHFSGQ